MTDKPVECVPYSDFEENAEKQPLSHAEIEGKRSINPTFKALS